MKQLPFALATFLLMPVSGAAPDSSIAERFGAVAQKLIGALRSHKAFERFRQRRMFGSNLRQRVGDDGGRPVSAGTQGRDRRQAVDGSSSNREWTSGLARQAALNPLE